MADTHPADTPADIKRMHYEETHAGERNRAEDENEDANLPRAGWFFWEGRYYYGGQEDGMFSIEKDGKSSGSLFPLKDLLSVEHLQRSGELCIAKKSGDILLWDPQNERLEDVGSCGESIGEMSWSPDQEITVFATESSKIIVMDSLFDIIEEVNLLDSTFGDSEFVVLGWGKKETQFHGSAGKKAAQKKEITDLPANSLPEDEKIDSKINIVWRGDGEYFAVNFLRDRQRLFKVFSRDGKLQYTSEKCLGLEGAIAWKPSGLWIAVPQNLPDKYVIALFEKNGLRHRELCLPFKRENEIVQSLKWSNDSTILAILTSSLAPLFPGSEEQTSIYLYTMGNYHWYLKQCLTFSSPVWMFDWDSSVYECKSLYVLRDTGSTHIYRWSYDVNCSAGQTDQDESLVGVIEGKNVLLTNFRGVVVPPPMCAFTLTCPDYINYVGFIQHPANPCDSNKFFTVTNQNLLTIYECSFTDAPSPVRHIEGCKEVECLIFENSFHGHNLFHWLTEELLIVDSPTKNNKSRLILMRKYKIMWDTVDEIKLNNLATGITSCDGNSLIVSLLNKSVLKVKISNGKFAGCEEFYSLPEFCEKTVSVKIGAEEKIFSLQTRQMLYLNGDKFQQDVTSFAVAHPFLLYTTVDELRIINLTNMNVDTVRKTERGARIVAIVPKHDRTVLQMPRGNLEAIQPRALTLLIIGDLLHKNQYRKAYEILRKQRINLNLIVDHNPKEFFEKIDVFLNEISNPSWLNLFLTDLQNEDVTTTIYEGSYRMLKVREYPENYTIEGKVERICEEMCKKMQSRNEKHLLLPIITSFVKRKDIESALRVIWEIRNAEKANGGHLGDFSESEDALNYLLYLVDVNKLYDIALGMYDFRLVLFVAEKSQKDPKEYISYLNDLNQLDEYYRRFKIDLHLKRYEKALENISKCEGKFDECLKLVKDRHLHAKALTLFPSNSEEYKNIAKAYADHLRYRGFLEEASLMYERAGNLDEAIQTAKNTMDFNRSLSLKMSSGVTDEELKEFVHSLIPAMIENGKYREAADIIKVHIKDSQQVIETLLEGKLYMAAIYEWNECKGSDCTRDYIQGHLRSYTEVLMDCMRNDRMQFVSYKTRLSVVRKKRTEEPEEEDPNHFDDCDLYSDTTSVISTKHTGSSRGSSKTHKSSKSRRKHKRKLYSLKEGNPFEDIALIDALHNLAIKCFGQQQHIKEICKATIMLNIDEMGKQLQVNIILRTLLTERDN
uniref:Elongator complex protein 1 n=1 Tax=Lutzomyia longipalpis TaxID=7200 RepID=A0A1B0CDB8_LUTLO